MTTLNARLIEINDLSKDGADNKRLVWLARPANHDGSGLAEARFEHVVDTTTAGYYVIGQLGAFALPAGDLAPKPVPMAAPKPTTKAGKKAAAKAKTQAAKDKQAAKGQAAKDAKAAKADKKAAKAQAAADKKAATQQTKADTRAAKGWR